MNAPTPLAALSGPRRTVELEGRHALMLPSAVAEQSTMAAMFAAPHHEVQKLVPSARLKLVQAYPGTSLLCIACSERRRVEGLAPYLEVALLVPVRYSPRLSVPLLPLLAPQLFQDAGYYVHRTLVSTPEALSVGSEVHGARATLADIRFSEQPFWRRCSVHVDGQLLLSLDIRKSRGRPMALTTFAYTLREGQVLRTPVPLSGELGFRRGHGAAKLELGEHYIAHELRALKLAESPLLTTYAPELSSVLAAPDRTLAP